MSRAIGRAIGAATPHEQERAMRWVAAWGLIGGIRSDTVRLRNPGLLQPQHSASAPAEQEPERTHEAAAGQVPAEWMQPAPSRGRSPQSA